MGTLSFSVSEYGQRANTLQSTLLATSGAHTTSTTASYVEDADGDITLQPGQVIVAFADEAMRIRIGAVATATVGHYIPANIPMWFECREAGLVSAIDVA
jgi:hypothetical protein